MNAQTILIFALIGVLAMVLAAKNWRHAVLLVLIAGFSQDAIRKLVPGEPVIVVMLSSMMMGIALMVAMTRVGIITLRPLTQGSRVSQIVLLAYIGLVLAQAMMAFIRYKHPVIPAIGMIVYLGAIPAVWLAYRFLRTDKDLHNFMRLYVALAVLLAVSIAMEKLGVQSSVFGQVGEGLFVYDREVGVVKTFSGTLRSPEVAAWHLGSACCMMMMLAIAYRQPLAKLITPPLVLSLLVIAMLTGRRKVLVVVVAFVIIYFALLVYYRQRSGTRALMLLAAVGCVVAAATLFLAPEKSSLDPYMTRGSSVFEGAFERFQRLGIGSIEWALGQVGPWGVGAGAVSQGTQHFGGASADVRGAAEGGLGKIVVELGLMGLFLMALVAIRVAVSVLFALRKVANSDESVLLRVNLGLLAFCLANVPVFIGASQVYGDPFVLFFLGSCLGFVLAGSRLVDLRLKLSQRAVAARTQGRIDIKAPQLVSLGRRG